MDQSLLHKRHDINLYRVGRGGEPQIIADFLSCSGSLTEQEQVSDICIVRRCILCGGEDFFVKCDDEVPSFTGKFRI